VITSSCVFNEVPSALELTRHSGKLHANTCW